VIVFLVSPIPTGYKRRIARERKMDALVALLINSLPLKFAFNVRNVGEAEIIEHRPGQNM
jgi:hypothetical protein